MSVDERKFSTPSYAYIVTVKFTCSGIEINVTVAQFGLGQYCILGENIAQYVSDTNCSL